MKKIIITIIIIILIIGGYVFIKDREIKRELSSVEQSKFIDSKIDNVSKDSVSKITMDRRDGLWDIKSTSDYTINTDSLNFEFIGHKPGGQHAGTFNIMSAEISLDVEGNPVSANFIFDPSSVKTDNSSVDKHLQAPEFFDTEKYSQIIANVREIKKEEDGSTKAITDLTMKGVSKTLAIPVTVTPIDSGFKFAIGTRITISDYEIAFGPVLDEVRVILEGELIKK